MVKGCWVLFVVVSFWCRDKKRRLGKEFDDFMRWRDRGLKQARGGDCLFVIVRCG